MNSRRGPAPTQPRASSGAASATAIRNRRTNSLSARNSDSWASSADQPSGSASQARSPSMPTARVAYRHHARHNLLGSNESEQTFVLVRIEELPCHYRIDHG